MAQQLTNIKKRISSITGAYKITSAMKLVSSVKLKRWRKIMLQNRQYAEEIEKVTNNVFKHCMKVNSPFIDAVTKSNKKLYIIVSSTLGLCGSYNNNILRLADSNISQNDDIIVLGGKGLAHYIDSENEIIPGFENVNSITDESFQKNLSNFFIEKFLNGTYKEIHLIYSEYVNALVFRPKDSMLLPFNGIKEQTYEVGPIIEPSSEQIIEKLIPLYIRCSLQSKILESEVCEQASRNNAMENATKNAEDLLSQLKIEYNKARQGAITQEIIEIVASSSNV